MTTQILDAFDIEKDSDSIDIAAKLLREGKTVIFPTETVYGLGANAFDESAVKNIFVAKGRPSDNPLIVHISDVKDIEPLVTEIPDILYTLAEKFWPGALTVILPKSQRIPYITSGGLDTVAIRIPQNEIAREIIKRAGVPIAAPSANLSGSPSPTTFLHCKSDMMGRVDAIINSFDSLVGVESTVLLLDKNEPRILRPGGITYEMLLQYLPNLQIDKGVLNIIADNEKASSPGMKYKHYAPNADCVLVKANTKSFCDFVKKEQQKDKNVYVICFDEDIEFIENNAISYGKVDDHTTQAHNIFAVLRQTNDIENISKIYIHAPSMNDVGLAVYNRLIRSCAFNITEL